MGESRKAFESWIANTTNSDLHRSVMLDRRESGSYSHLATENKWEAWQASRAAIELDIDWPESNDDFWKDGEEGAYAMGYEDGRDKTVIAVMKAIRAAGIKEKNFDEANIHASQRSNQK
ncbi:hypothetical protein PS040_16975 [Escherichia albertii]|nr:MULTISPECIES: hypothetical protein [Escherichia]WDC10112.1 hypothetical protein PS040_16975 [Escherichia albertii]